VNLIIFYTLYFLFNNVLTFHFTSLNSSTEGLYDAEAASRLEKNGPNEIKEDERK